MASAVRLRTVSLTRRMDHTVGRALFALRVLVDARTPMNLAVLAPMWREMLADERLDVRFTGPDRDDLARAFAAEGVASRVVARTAARMRRWDLYMNADPWDPAVLRRCRRRINFSHGVAGKYDLECPAQLPLNLECYDRIAFPNEGRMRRYIEAGVVRADRAMLVGFPKLDRLVNARVAPRAAASAMGLPADRPTAIYAPTFSPQSSLHQHGLDIVKRLLEASLNVIVKLHDRSLDPDPRYSGGHDWRSRFDPFTRNRRFLFAAAADSTDYLLAAELMVTDHSTVGFEFCAIDRPLIVFDVPELHASARIDPGKAALLRRAAHVVDSPDDMPAAIARAIGSPRERASERALATREAFYDPGRATARALAACYELLECPALTAEPHAAGAARGSCFSWFQHRSRVAASGAPQGSQRAGASGTPPQTTQRAGASGTPPHRPPQRRLLSKCFSTRAAGAPAARFVRGGVAVGGAARGQDPPSGF